MTNEEDDSTRSGFRPMNVGENAAALEDRVDPFVNKHRALARRLTKRMRSFCKTIKDVLCPNMTTNNNNNNNEDGYHYLTPESTFWEHCEGLSHLSRVFLILFLMTAIVGSMMSFLPVWFVLVITIQPIATLYIVYWRHHRLDLSLNAVVQYFSIGFVLAFYLVASVIAVCAGH